MAEYIEREAVLKKQIGVVVYDEGGWDANVRAVPVEDIEAIPTADVAPVVHSNLLIEVEGNGWGEWDNLTCKRCGKKHKKVAWPNEWHYCPNCGAKMDGEVNKNA